jgi:hypothetical protein
VILCRQVGGQRFGSAPYHFKPLDGGTAIGTASFFLHGNFKHDVPHTLLH